MSDAQKLKITNTKRVWVAWTNTDRTEGRGSQIPLAVCDIRATAVRLGKGKDVQGSNCTVTEELAVSINGSKWLATAKIEYPTVDDKKAQKVYDEKLSVAAKARQAGLTDEEIQVLSKRI